MYPSFGHGNRFAEFFVRIAFKQQTEVSVGLAGIAGIKGEKGASALGAGDSGDTLPDPVAGVIGA